MKVETQKAVALVKQGMTVYQAAKQYRLAQSTVARAITRAAMPRCVTCGGKLK